MIDAPASARARPTAGVPGLARLIAWYRSGTAGGSRRWLLLCCLALAALAFASHPGQILADTKIDLAIDPAEFLRRALHLWDPAQFGQLQNQAVGYFFPIGPFFAAGKLAALPAWVIQRLWITFILLAAFVGVVRLCRVLELGSPATRIVAGLSYALAPNALSLVGYDSAEFLPVAMLPWILVPVIELVHAGPAATAGQRARLAAQSAVAVAMCSGVNATATAAVLVPPVIYLLTARRPSPRWRIMAWWAAAVVLANLWWLYPLVLLGKYGASFLPYTESADVTTSVTSLSNALRGTENWLSYLVVDGRSWVPDGFALANGALPTILTGLIAGLGITGLLRRDPPQCRRFLLWLLLVGIVTVVAGYVSPLGNPLATVIDDAINGPLAPLRNLDKFDPLIRLPIALGLASLLAQARPGRPRAILAATGVGSIALLALPVYVAGLSTPGSFSSVPGYWVRAADWLNTHAGNSAVLEEPGARFGQYTWGSPLDDILQPLFVGDWATSQLGTIGSVGNTRLIQAIDQQVSDGVGSPGLTQVLGRMGVKYVVVRNDLLRADLDGAWPARVHDALAASPGIVKVAQFGSAPARAPAPTADTSFNTPYPPVQIYQVRGAQPAAVVQPTAATLRVYGAPEALLPLANAGVLQDRPVLLNGAAPQVRASATIITDSLRRQVRNFGEIRNDFSPTLTASQPLTTFEATADFTEPSWAPYVSVARYTGIRSISASSSASDIDAVPGQAGTGLLPFAAIDGNLHTRWESGSPNGPVGQWIKIVFDAAIDPGRVRVAFAGGRPHVTQVAITTAAGRVVDRVRVTGRYQSLRLPAGPSSWLRITVTRVDAPPSQAAGRQVAIAEISIPGVHASRSIVAPAVPLPGGADPSAVELAKAVPQPSGCMQTPQSWVCSPALQIPTEEQYGFDESFTIARAHAATLTGSAVLTDPGLVARYAYPGSQQPVVRASSTYTADPEDQAAAAFDGDPKTVWIAGASDPHPTLTIRWRGRKRIGSITVLRPAGASGLVRVQITGTGGQTRGVVLGGPGIRGRERISFAPMTTDSLTLRFGPSPSLVQISDIEIPGVRPLTTDPAAALRLGCGQGPVIGVNGKTVQTRVSGTVADILAGRPVTFTACSPVALAAGSNTVAEPGSDAFSVQAVTVDLDSARLTPVPPVPAAAARVLSWSPARRVLRVAVTRQSYLIVNENFNAGWQAALHGRVLQPVELDGWKQGWLLPAGSRGQVTLTYLPDGQYRVSLVGGLAALGAVILVAVASLRRRRPGIDATAAEPDVAPAGPQTSGVLRRCLLVGGLCLTGLVGVWTGGYPAAVGLPVLTLGFVLALAWQSRSRLARAAAEPWLAAALLLVAAGCAAAGHLLAEHAVAGSVLTVLSATAPQVACLVIVARIAAAVMAICP